MILIYHDVVAQLNTSGFTGAGADRYKLTPKLFREHLAALAELGQQCLLAGKCPLALTFDDGGVSAMLIADLLEDHGWRGYFFVTTDYLGTNGFLSMAQVRTLHERGHIIGSHSCSHPERMSLCPVEQMEHEWHQSCCILTDIIGVPVTTASVPGGFYSRKVAVTAAKAGIRSLFTSEPTLRTSLVDGCLVLGRFSILRETSAEEAASLAAGNVFPRLRQAVTWNLKKVAKVIGGRHYLNFRRRYLQNQS